MTKGSVLLAFLCFPFFAHATEPPAADKCAYDKAAMLALDENAFDQDVSNGGGGWRAIGNIPGCEIAAADLIAAYKRKHGLDTPILNWHEGQMRASAGQTERAIGLLSAARKDGEPGQEAWNEYVDATVAFLRRDRQGLLRARDRLAQAPIPEGMPPVKDGYMELEVGNGQTMKMRWPMNIDVVDGLIACFDKPYDEAYGGECRPKP
ncbi:MAG: hypothetical protein QM761_08410 [Pseudoxanthomonas sp.]